MMRSPSSSSFVPAARDPDAASVRPRNRRLLSAHDDPDSSSALSTPSRTPSRGASPIPAEHIGSVTGRNDSGRATVRSPPRAKNSGAGRGLLDGSWTPSWASVQEMASSLLAGGFSSFGGETQGARGRDGSRSRKPSGQPGYRNDHKNDTWGPAPPSEGRPRPDDIAAGSLAKREAALKAVRTASVLESHEGVNGGLDVLGKYKKRSSDEDLRGASQSQEMEEYLAYIHHVQPTDTYAGIVLKYRCREDAFRKANGLWSRDNIQVRKWLAIPVDACEVKGRPCDPPAGPSAEVDLLARTPDKSDDPFGPADFSPGSPMQSTPSRAAKAGGDDKPWTHVRWVSIDSCPHPVEVARVPRKALGYFPPRRKRSIQTTSEVSTPRGSADLPGAARSEAAFESPRSSSSRRLSRSTVGSARGGASSTPAPRSRLNSSGAGDDPRPAWMRRPGGVGSLNQNVRAPGPDKDPLNSWTRKHLPGLNIDSLPSMSIMGSETARFGFSSPDETASAALVESPFEDGREVASTSRQGSGLDKAAAAVETWLRGAIERARQSPLTPVLGPRGRPGGGGGGGSGVGGVGVGGSTADVPGDLIELTDTNSDDGRHELSSVWDTGGLLSSLSASVSGAASGSARRSPLPWATGGSRGRGPAPPGPDKKAD